MKTFEQLMNELKKLSPEEIKKRIRESGGKIDDKNQHKRCRQIHRGRGIDAKADNYHRPYTKLHLLSP